MEPAGRLSRNSTPGRPLPHPAFVADYGADSIDPPCQCCGQEDGREEGIGPLVIAGCDASEILEAAEHSLDDVTSFAGSLVVAVRMLAGRVWRDDGLDPPPGKHFPQASGIVSAIREEPLGLLSHREQAARSFEVVNVPGRDQQGARTTNLVGQGVNLGRLPATRPADGVIERPPFAPAAERWALM